MANKMLIDATHPEETRVVVLRGNRVEEFDFETAQRKQLRGNIYLAKVTRVEPSLQAAFIDYGGNRHGFLAFSEIHPDYYQIPVADRQALLDEESRSHREDEEEERGGRSSGNRSRRSRSSRSSSRPNDVVRSEAVDERAADDESRDDSRRDDDRRDDDRADDNQPPADTAADEAAPPRAAASDTFVPEAGPLPPPLDEQPQPIGETANPPVAAEIGAPDPTRPQDSDHTAGHQSGHQTDHDHDQDRPADGSVAAIARADGEADRSHDDSEHRDDASRDDHDDEDDDRAAGDEHEEEEVVESVGGADAIEEVMERAPRYRRQYKIQEVIKRRQVMLVQVVKEERGTKGAALTTYLSLAGRYSVLMPNTARGGGISRKITNNDDRRKLREIADELEVPEGMGVILRTAGASRSKAEVKRDFEYLLRLWETVRDLTLKSSAPTLTYEEGSLAKRSIRDLYSKDIEEIVVAGEGGYREAKDFMRMLMPSHARNVKAYNDSQPLFTRYGIETQLDAMFQPTVQLRSGGYIVINQTEALVAIDVNSGRSTREHHIEDTALKTNCEAADEVARQLRLRDLAGLIVIDFIDMDEKRNNRTVERRMKDALKNDRARIQVGRISHFGLLEMSRQRIRTSVLESSTEKCEHCGGTGHMRSVSSVALQLLRALEESLIKGGTHNQIVRTRPEVALYVLNHKRAHLTALEQRFRVSITIEAQDDLGGQTSFAVDRGEQVMTAEQARALAAEFIVPALPEEPEPDYEPEPEDEEEAESGSSRGSDDSSVESVGDDDEDDDEARADGNGNGSRSSSSESGPKRRRRRRGRGGSGSGSGSRAGEGRSPDPRSGDTRSGEEHATANGSLDRDETASSQDDDDESAAPLDATSAGGEGDDTETNGARGENGEPRKRRRGRRGGRRYRRDREDGETNASGDQDAPGEASGDGAAHTDTPVGEPADAPHSFEQAAQVYPASDAPAESPQASASQPLMSPPAAPDAEAPATASAVSTPRRRSTVREPAPSLVSAVPAVTETEAAPAPLAEPALERTPEPVAADAPAAANDEPAKPRRTGWWAKRLLGGGDKA